MQKEPGVGTQVEGYYLLRELGKGQFGKVFKAHLPGSKHEYAIKVICKKKISANPNLVKLLETEVEVMKNNRHSNLIYCHKQSEDPNYHYLVLDYCNEGDLDQYVKTHTHLSEGDSVFFLKQLINGFYNLNQRKVMHRDFKPTNIFKHNDTLVIGDFGFAKRGVNFADSTLGTPITQAPEIMLSEGRTSYCNKVDIWSLGVTFYFMLFGQFPWAPISKENLKNLVVTQCGCQLLFPDEPKISPDAKNLLRRMIAYPVNQRISWRELFKYSLLKNSSIKMSFGYSSMNLVGTPIVESCINFKGSQQLTNQLFDINGEHCIADGALMPVSRGNSYPPGIKESDQISGIMDRLNHKRRVARFILQTGDLLLQEAQLTPNAFEGYAQELYKTALLTLKRVQVLNKQLIHNIVNDEMSRYELESWSKFKNNPQYQILLQELIGDGESLNMSISNLIPSILKMRSSKEVAHSIELAFDNTVTLSELNKELDSTIVVIIANFSNVFKEPTSQPAMKLKFALARLYLTLDPETTFKYQSSENERFDWTGFEKTMHERTRVQFINDHPFKAQKTFRI